MRRALLLALLLTAGAAYAASSDELAREGFRTPPDQLKAKVGKICLTALDSDLEIAEWEARAAWFEQFLAHKLAHAGFESAPSARVGEVLSAAAKAAGGAYDPLTGRAMPTKRAAVQAAQRTALASELGCHALLVPAIHLVRLRWDRGVAAWDYVRHAMGGGELYLGTADGLSLRLSLVALDDTELLVRSGGIEPLARLEGGVWFDPEWKDADPRALLNDTTLNARAVIAALGALAVPAPTEVQACVDAAAAASRKEIDRAAQRAACEVQRFAFVPPAKPQDAAPAP